MDRLKNLSRRTWLGGAATLVALPFLEELAGVRSVAQADTTGVKRLILFTFPTGVYRDAWNFTQSLKPLVDGNLQNDVIVVKNVSNPPGNGPRGHTAGAGAVLTCHHVPTIADAGGSHTPVNTISMDQIVAQALGGKPTVELGTMTCPENPNGEEEYIPEYKDNYSWTGPTTQKHKITDPKIAFDQIFAGFDPTASNQEALRRAAYQQSVVDAVRADASSLRVKLGVADQQRLDQYLSALRTLELKIAANVNAPKCTPGFANTGKPDDPGKHADLMLEIMTTVHTCDIARVSTFSYEYTTTPRSPAELNIGQDYHGNVTHHDADPDKIAKYIKHNTWCVQKLADYLNTLKNTMDPANGKSMFDNSIVYFTSELGDGSEHSANNLPIIVAGGGGGSLMTGRTVDGSGQSVSNLYISLMGLLGVNATTFGDDGKAPLKGF